MVVVVRPLLHHSSPFRKGGGSDVSYVRVQRARMAQGYTMLIIPLSALLLYGVHKDMTI